MSEGNENIFFYVSVSHEQRKIFVSPVDFSQSMSLVLENAKVFIHKKKKTLNVLNFC